jgi:hypothetical protein
VLGNKRINIEEDNKKEKNIDIELEASNQLIVTLKMTKYFVFRMINLAMKFK